MRIKRVNLSDAVGMNMTPMIDIVFQLIIFLMLATDFANLKVEALVTPVADVAIEDDHPDKDRLTINIKHELSPGVVCTELGYEQGRLVSACNRDEHWKVKVDGEELSPARLKEILITEAAVRGTDNPVMVRADSGAPYRFLASVLQAASGAGFWRIEIGARRPAK